MRMITREACHAFENGENFYKSNTQVKADCTGVRMYLFGNLIAERVGERVRITLAGWNSATTRERLNGLRGVNISQKNFIPYLNGKEMDTKEFYQI